MNADRTPLPRLLVPAEEPSRGGRHDRRRPRQRRHDRPVQRVRWPPAPPGCSVPDWDCVRATSYVYPATPISTPGARRRSSRKASRSGSTSRRTAVTTPAAHRCVTNYIVAAVLIRVDVPEPDGSGHQPDALHRVERLVHPGQVELRELIRLDTNYYYWPAGWVQDRPGSSPARPSHAVHRPRRHDDRRLPGGYPDDRRVRTDAVRRRSTHSSIGRSGRTASTGPSPPTSTLTSAWIPVPLLLSLQRRRVACRSSRRVSCSTGPTPAACRTSAT